MTESRKKEIENLTQSLILQTSGETVFASIFSIINAEKIRLLKKEDIKKRTIDSFIQILYFPSPKTIVVQDTEDILQISHELGHYFLHGEYGSAYKNSQKDANKRSDIIQDENQNTIRKENPNKNHKFELDLRIRSREKELEADYFALFLTMPIDFFEMIKFECNSDLYKVSQHFRVPMKAVKKRIEYPKGLYR